jgi:hypothetical protein
LVPYHRLVPSENELVARHRVHLGTNLFRAVFRSRGCTSPQGKAFFYSLGVNEILTYNASIKVLVIEAPFQFGPTRVKLVDPPVEQIVIWIWAHDVFSLGL